MKKCPYCDFNSHEAKPDQSQFSDYLQVLIRDLEYSLPDILGRQIISVFIGGGTPSLFPAETIMDLMSALQARLNLHPNSEVTLEASPGKADAGNFSGYREAGINRLSIGVQSFDVN